MVNAIADACLSCQVDHNIEMILLEEGVDEGFITNGTFDEHVFHRGSGCNRVNLLQPPLLQTYLIVVVHVVERNDGSGGEGLEKADHKIRADETGGAGYKDGLVVEVDFLFFHTFTLTNMRYHYFSPTKKRVTFRFNRIDPIKKETHTAITKLRTQLIYGLSFPLKTIIAKYTIC